MAATWKTNSFFAWNWKLALLVLLTILFTTVYHLVAHSREEHHEASYLLSEVIPLYLHSLTTQNEGKDPWIPYYNAPFCRPPVIVSHALPLGVSFRDDQVYSSLYEVMRFFTLSFVAAVLASSIPSFFLSVFCSVFLPSFLPSFLLSFYSIC